MSVHVIPTRKAYQPSSLNAPLQDYPTLEEFRDAQQDLLDAKSLDRAAGMLMNPENYPAPLLTYPISLPVTVPTALMAKAASGVNHLEHQIESARFPDDLQQEVRFDGLDLLV